MSYETAPAGLELAVAGVAHAAPYSEPAIVGSSVPLAALSPQTLGGSAYYWVSWADGGEQSRTLVAGAPGRFLARLRPRLG